LKKLPKFGDIYFGTAKVDLCHKFFVQNVKK
jgi:hypothetical protein